MSRQFAALARLRALRHFDLQFVRIHEVFVRHAKPAGGDLFDCAAAQVAVRIRHAGGGSITQEQMADWLDDIRGEIDTSPRDGGRRFTVDELVDIIDTLNVNLTAAQKDVRTSGHGRTIVFSEDTKITGGKNNVEIPNKITVLTLVFMGMDKVWRFEIRISVLARPGQPTQFRLTIPRLDDVIEAATADAMAIVADIVGPTVPIYAGTANHGGDPAPIRVHS